MYKLILFLGTCSAFALGSKLPAPADKNKSEEKTANAGQLTISLVYTAFPGINT